MKEITVDQFSKIGKSHKVCEDYIISGISPFPYMILADGCSSSSHVDVGARLIAHAALKILERNLYDDIVSEHELISRCYMIINEVDLASRTIGLPESSLDATLIMTWVEAESINTLWIGDGLVIKKLGQNPPIYAQVSFEKNCPFYLSYFLSRKRLDAHRKVCGVEGMKKVDLNKIGDIPEPIYNQTFIYDSIPLSQLEGNCKILISSDGLESFINIDSGIKVPTKEVLDKVMAFKNFNGEFLQRRMNRVINDYEKERIYHDDDISVGIFNIEEIGDEGQTSG